MPVNDGDLIVALAARGDGVGESGRYHPLTAPGDRVLADGLVEAGPHRQVPLCRHFPECGGCQLQHVDDPAYAGFMRDRIVSALAAQGVVGADILPAHISPPNSRRRAALRAERSGALGFNAEASHRVVDMRECHILRPELFALVAPLAGLLRRLRPAGQAGVRLTLADQGVDLLLEKVVAESLTAVEALTDFAREHRLARLALDDGYGARTLWEPEPVTVTLGAIPVALPHGAFLQATAEGEAALVDSVRLAVSEARIAADLFAGLGTFALALTGRILAVEGDRDAALALKAAAGRARRPVFVDHRDLYRRPLDPAELERFEAVVIDPPRAGAKEQAVMLARSAVKRLAYVSCNPSTFARDAAVLAAGGYRLDWIRPVGQFRWSTHVELVGAFSR
ncbi:MAG TPA: class I SAM-dependent RNA methyltransferase [Allosphingosinicella sp.]|nr:class I SAM-dependent RNA methyltransferase [Allosphingosinicella sp.]